MDKIETKIDLEDTKYYLCEKISLRDKELAPGSETLLIGYAVNQIDEAKTKNEAIDQYNWYMEAYNILSEISENEKVWDAVMDGNLELARTIAEKEAETKYRILVNDEHVGPTQQGCWGSEYAENLSLSEAENAKQQLETLYPNCEWIIDEMEEN